MSDGILIIQVFSVLCCIIMLCISYSVITTKLRLGSKESIDGSEAESNIHRGFVFKGGSRGFITTAQHSYLWYQTRLAKKLNKYK